MGELVSNIRKLAAERSWDEREFKGRCFAAGLSMDTADDLWGGKTNITASTMQKVASVFGVNMAVIITEKE